ncbi:MAG: hypothetical protein KF906_02045 [Actinobacteria bacterium]|nr:hypothetical protein [Actinomycetota bacterium]
MRIEQLVLYGPRDDERVRFGPGVTVFAGLSSDERRALIRTLVDALTGTLSNASVVYVDAQGRKVFADRTGATYADDGTPAPAPHDVLGRDVAAVTRLLTVGGADLGIGGEGSIDELRAELTDARHHLERREEEVRELETRSATLTEWRGAMASLTARIDRADDDRARWDWVQERTRLDELRADLNLADPATRGRTDQQILGAVDALRTAGESWAELAAQASELRAGLGPLPAVSQADLDRVASTPADLPPDFTARFEAWRAATDLRLGAEAELHQATLPPRAPDDALVEAFSSLDQQRLWERHAELVEANAAYARLSGPTEASTAPAEAEEAIEAAHVEVVRCQREVERLQRVGIMATGALGLLGLVMVQVVHPLLGLLALVAAAGIAAAAVVVPRRRLAAAELVEEQALQGTDADSWLGLHLRRLDTVTDATERKQFERVAKRRAAAQVAWDEIAGAVTPEDLAARADAVRAHADALNPKVQARRAEEAKTFATAARKAEEAARTAVLRGLEPYGFSTAGPDDLDPEQLASQLPRRIAAGEVARRALLLTQVERREADAGRHLDDLLRRLGFTDGSIEGRLERAITAVTSARDREGTAPRTAADIRREIETVIEHLRSTARPTWAGTPDPVNPPTDPAVLDARRREIAELVASAGTVDVPAARQRVEVARTRVTDLEERLEGLAGRAGSLQHRLSARLGRTTHLQDHEESVPVLIDDAFREVPAVQRFDLLDQLDRAAPTTQVIVLSDDDVVARWARDRSNGSNVTLYEMGPEPTAGAHPMSISTDVHLGAEPEVVATP